jgi:hypothetical protein
MTRHPDLPTDDDTAAINADFLAGRINDTGWWDDLGRPAPRPDDLDDWRPSTDKPTRINF